jgi:hypothetical protein
MLQRVLDNDDSTARANSLILLIDAGLIDDAKDEIRNMCQHPSQIPKWTKHPLETSTGVLEGSRQEAGPVQVGTGTPKRRADSTISGIN